MAPHARPVAGPGRMKRINDHIRAHLLRRVLDGPIGGETRPLDEMLEAEWDPLFERLMRERLILGAFRYRPMHSP
ncbi:MAG: hypothetical protein U5L11_02585 [Arhodomonas sp.]|nr:hypothetical protein [Arhodomonas sp.]